MFGWTRPLSKAAEAVCTAAFFAMFALFIAGIVMRYVVSAPLSWTDELIMVIFLWLVFLVDPLVLSEREQVTFDAVYGIVGERARWAIAIIAALVTAGVFIASLPTVLDYVRFLWRERTNALQWRLDWVYACFVVFWCGVILRAAAKFVRLAGPNWRAEVALARPDERANILG